MALIVTPRQRPGILPPKPESGLMQGLQQLLQGKLEKITRRRETERTESALEKVLPKNLASAIAGAPKNMQAQLLKSYMENAGGSGVDDQLADIFGGSQDAPIGTDNAGIDNIDNIGGSGDSADLGAMLNSIGSVGDKPTTDADILQNVLSATAPTSKAVKPAPIKKPAKKAIAKPAQSDEVKDLRKALSIRGLTRKQRAGFQKQLQDQLRTEKKAAYQEKKFAEDRQEHIDKETKDYYADTLKKHVSSTETDMRLARLDQLVKNKQLDDPITSSVLDATAKGIFGFGVNLDSLRSPDSQEFQKLSAEFLKGAKAIFGARVTQKEMEMFMKMVPTLIQSEEGKMRVINNMKAYSKAGKLRKDTMVRLIKENGGRRPRHLQLLVEDAVEPELAKLAEEFTKGYELETPKEEPRRDVLSTIMGWKKPRKDLLDLLAGWE